MTSLISSSDVEVELGTSLPDLYTDIIIASMSDDAEDQVRFSTKRVTFSGITATIYKRAVLLWMVQRIVRSNPKLAKGNIKTLSESDKSITYSGTSGIDAYKEEYDGLIKKLARSSSTISTSETNEETFYASTESDDEW